MVLVLKKGASKKEIEAIEKKLYKEKTPGGFNAKKYNGVLNLKFYSYFSFFSYKGSQPWLRMKFCRSKMRVSLMRSFAKCTLLC